MSEQAVAIITAIVTLAATFLVHRLSQERKHFDYEFISGVRLLADEATRLAGDLELRFKTSVIKDPYLLIVRLINSGNKPLVEEDFEQPIRIELDAPVLSAWIAKSEREELMPGVKWYSDTVEIAPALFNKGDWIALGALTDGEPPEKNINVRIVGVKKPRKFEHFSKALNQSAIFLGILAGLVSLLGTLLLIDPMTDGAFQRWADMASPPNVADPPWQYYAISVSALLMPILIGVFATRLVRKLSQRTTRTMKVLLRHSARLDPVRKRHATMRLTSTPLRSGLRIAVDHLARPPASQAH